MPRTKSLSTHATSAPRKSRSGRSSSKAQSSRGGVGSKFRRYLDFIRAILGNSPRNGR